MVHVCLYQIVDANQTAIVSPVAYVAMVNAQINLIVHIVVYMDVKINHVVISGYRQRYEMGVIARQLSGVKMKVLHLSVVLHLRSVHQAHHHRVVDVRILAVNQYLVSSNYKKERRVWDVG